MRALSSIAFVLTVVASASVAEAQITTVVVPPRQPRAPRSVAAADSGRAADSAAVLEQRLTTMREWVDSAALALDAQPSVAAGDTTAAGAAAGGAPPADAVVPAAPGVSGGLDSAAGEPAFREGATAPDTASALPLVLVLSGAAIGIGAVLRRC